MKTTDEEFNKLLEKFTPKEIIRLHCESKINLTAKQLEKIIKLKNTNGIKSLKKLK